MNLEKLENRLLWIAVLAFGFALLCGCASYPVTHGVPNFGIVEPGTNGMAGMYRGGDPVDWSVLKAMGVTNVVQLDFGNCHEPPGFNVMRFPISLWKQYLGHPGTVLEAAYAAMEAHPQAEFTHCRVGANRTGAEIYLWRRRHDHWTRDAALAEYYAHGGKTSGWALARYVRNN